MQGKYIHSVDKSNFWLEIPRAQHEVDKAMWFRTKHSNNDDYFAWVVNQNGSISPKSNTELVLGYGIATNEEHWKDLSNSYDWKKFKTLEGFAPTPLIDANKELGKCLKLCGEEDRWMEIPYGEPIEYNFAWLRTHHGGEAHFNYKFNKDGTISPEGEDDLVWGLADASPCSKWKDVIANNLDWKKTRTEKKRAEKEEEERIKNMVSVIVDDKLAGL